MSRLRARPIPSTPSGQAVPHRSEIPFLHCRSARSEANATSIQHGGGALKHIPTSFPLVEKTFTPCYTSNLTPMDVRGSGSIIPCIVRFQPLRLPLFFRASMLISNTVQIHGIFFPKPRRAYADLPCQVRTALAISSRCLKVACTAMHQMSRRRDSRHVDELELELWLRARHDPRRSAPKS
jgi:hypothetical protein